jgi:hypothetical protein
MERQPVVCISSRRRLFDASAHYCVQSRKEFHEIITGVLASVSCVETANAVMMKRPEVNVFEVGVLLSADVSKARFEDARKTLYYLVDNFDEISKGGGDNVRRYLGTVGTSSALYGIDRVMKGLQDKADDIVQYTENMQDFDYYLRAADTAVYSANFVEFSAAKTKPEKFFQDAKSDCKKMIMHMDNMAEELKIQ